MPYCHFLETGRIVRFGASELERAELIMDDVCFLIQYGKYSISYNKLVSDLGSSAARGLTQVTMTCYIEEIPVFMLSTTTLYTYIPEILTSLIVMREVQLTEHYHHARDQ